MSGTKSSANTSKSSDINRISPELRTAYKKIMYHIQHQLFLDPDLNHQQRIFLLYQPGAIENEFFLYLYDYIYDFSISEDLRDSSFQNLSKLNTNLIPVDIYSGINQYNLVDDDSDDEAYADNVSDIDSDANDTYADLENILLDEIEFEHDLAAFHPSAEKNHKLSADDSDKENSCK